MEEIGCRGVNTLEKLADAALTHNGHLEIREALSTCHYASSPLLYTCTKNPDEWQQRTVHNDLVQKPGALRADPSRVRGRARQLPRARCYHGAFKVVWHLSGFAFGAVNLFSAVVPWCRGLIPDWLWAVREIFNERARGPTQAC